VGWGGVGGWGDDYKGCYDPVFEIKFEITVSRFEITAFEVKPSNRSTNKPEILMTL